MKGKGVLIFNFTVLPDELKLKFTMSVLKKVKGWKVRKSNLHYCLLCSLISCKKATCKIWIVVDNTNRVYKE